jgi:hypothetical protein
MARLKLGVKLSTRNRAVLARYIDDMRQAVREVSRVLVPGGKAVYVIGENTVRDTYIRTSAVVSALAEMSGLRLVDRRVRPLPANRRYLPPPAKRKSASMLDARMRSEVVLAFDRPA